MPSSFGARCGGSGASCGGSFRGRCIVWWVTPWWMNVPTLYVSFAAVWEEWERGPENEVVNITGF